MEAGKINSILNRKDAIEADIIEKENPGSLEERTEKIMSKSKEQYETHEEVDLIIQKARELLGKYGNSESIPENDLTFESSGFDDARLLAFCRIVEEEKSKSH
jgi:hypothetical protein